MRCTQSIKTGTHNILNTFNGNGPFLMPLLTVLVTPRDMFQFSRKKGQLANSSDQAMPFDVPDMKLIFSERWYPSVSFVFIFISFEMSEKFSSI